jgi:hypothetical protein
MFPSLNDIYKLDLCVTTIAPNPITTRGCTDRALTAGIFLSIWACTFSALFAYELQVQVVCGVCWFVLLHTMTCSYVVLCPNTSTFDSPLRLTATRI